MIKAIIFDMGGVLLLNDINAVYERLAKNLKIEPKLLLDLIRQNRSKFMSGEYSAEGFAKLIKDKFQLENDVAEIINIWKESFEGLMELNNELFNLITKLKQDYKIAMLTDAPQLHSIINKKKCLYESFEPCIISCEVGLVKPAREIYELVLKELKCEPSECLFIDDNEANIETAKDMGFHTILFRDNKQFLEELNKHNIEF